MRTMTIKNIPDEVYERLKQRAAAHRRSMNREVIVCLEDALFSRRVDPEEFLKRADALRARLSLPPLSDDLLRTTKSEGRP